jgi:hypothetical protein
LRAINICFSSGERKRREILQIFMLSAWFNILEKSDNALDIDALKRLSDNINALRTETSAGLIIMHREWLLDAVIPHRIHVLDFNPQSRLKRIAFSSINVGQLTDSQSLSFFSVSHDIILCVQSSRAFCQSVSLFSPYPSVQFAPWVFSLQDSRPVLWKPSPVTLFANVNAYSSRYDTFWRLGFQDWSTPIWIELGRILSLFTYFHVSVVSHFSFLSRLVRPVSTMKSASQSNVFPTSALPSNEVKVSQSDGGGYFKLSLYECETDSDRQVMNRHESTMSAPASKSLTLMRE